MMNGLAIIIASTAAFFTLYWVEAIMIFPVLVRTGLTSYINSFYELAIIQAVLTLAYYHFIHACYRVAHRLMSKRLRRTSV